MTTIATWLWGLQASIQSIWVPPSPPWTLTSRLVLCLLATEYHLGLLKAKLAKYRAQLLEPSKSSSSKGEGFDVMKSGDARVALIGFPSVGKVSDGQRGPQEEGSLSPLPPGCTSSLPLSRLHRWRRVSLSRVRLHPFVSPAGVLSPPSQRGSAGLGLVY